MNAFSDSRKTEQPAQTAALFRKSGTDVNIKKIDQSDHHVNCACGGNCPTCQKKSGSIQISKPADTAEIEADNIADKVMQMPTDTTTTVTSSKNGFTGIQRKSSAAEDNEKTIQRKTVSSSGELPSQSPPHVINAMSSGGHPLSNETRNFFEPRMGQDFGNVRVHTNSNANFSAQSVDAKAYTLGNNIVFGGDEFKPNSYAGRRLLAHELAHVVQSNDSSSAINPRTIHRTPSTAAEQELAAIDYEMEMLSQIPVMDPLVAASIGMQLGKLQQRRLALTRQPSSSGPTGTAQERLAAAMALLLKRGDSDYTIIFLQKQNIGIELKQVTISYYDPKLRKVILNADSSSAEMAQALLFESRKIQIDSRKHDIRLDLGIRAYENEKYRRGQGVGDDSLYEKYQPKTRDEYVSDKLSTIAEAAGDTIEYNRGMKAQGLTTSQAPLEAIYTKAYEQEYARQYGVTFAEIQSVNVADNRAREKGSAVGRAAVLDAIKRGQLLAGPELKTYGDSFDKEWADIEAMRAKKDAELAEARAKAKIESERSAKIEAMANGLAELVNKVDPESAEAEKVIKLVDAVFPLLGGYRFIFIKKADKGLDNILGPFGYRTVYGVDIGGLQIDRLEYGLGNYLALKPSDRTTLRETLRTNPFAAQRLGIQMWPTQAELEAEGRLVVMDTLTDGSVYVGRRDGIQAAEEQIRINHALQQLEAISNAGPGALIGRIVDGERGAAIGAMVDSGLMVVAPARARRNVRAQMRTMGDGVPGVPDARLQPLAIRRPLQEPGLTIKKIDVTNGRAFPPATTTVATAKPKPAPTSATPATPPTPTPATPRPAPEPAKQAVEPVAITPKPVKPTAKNRKRSPKEPKKTPTAADVKTPRVPVKTRMAAAQQGLTDAIARLKIAIAESRQDSIGLNKASVAAQADAWHKKQRVDKMDRSDPARADALKELTKAELKSKELGERYDFRKGLTDDLVDKQAQYTKALNNKTYERPTSYNTGVENSVWENAVKQSNGTVKSPSGMEIKPGDNWVMGHKPGWEFWKHQVSAARRGITRQQFLREFNDSKNYRPETAADNSGRTFEAPDHINHWP